MDSSELGPRPCGASRLGRFCGLLIILSCALIASFPDHGRTPAEVLRVIAEFRASHAQPGATSHDAGEFTPHGMRSSFRDWATEADRTEYATAERCLAHAVGFRPRPGPPHS